MPFLDDYTGTERIQLKHGYWIDIKVCLSRQEKRAADKAMSRMSMSATSDADQSPAARRPGQSTQQNKMRMAANPDIERYRDEVVFASIVDWNLDDERGVWPLSPPEAKRRSVDRLPDEVFDQVYKRANELNKEPEVDEQKTFRDGAELGDHDAEPGEDDPALVGEVPPGGGDVVEAWGEQGDLGAAALA